MLTPTSIAIVLTLAMSGAFIARRIQVEKAAELIESASIKAGHKAPTTLHPIIDESRCIGCGSCASACPERGVLGLIMGKARLVDPSHCIGHGACKDACPEDAIELVFGSKERGVDIPQLSCDFQTNVPGVFIAGELGGMGLIANALEQGRQAVDGARELCTGGHQADWDIIIVGAGPAGLAATLAAKQYGLRALTIEQDVLGGATAHYPRGKIVMTRPGRLPLIGKFRFAETTKEELVEFWGEVERRAELDIRYKERLEAVEPNGCGHFVQTTKGRYHTRTVLLAIGRRGTPRKLGVPGEDSPKVVYQVIDPAEYAGKNVLVVGGGDSALEAAIAIAEEPNTTVTISYRSAAFSRAKEKNRERVSALGRESRLCVLMESNVREILDGEVELDRNGETHRLDNDAVVVCAGGILPTPLLRKIGIEIQTKFGTA